MEDLEELSKKHVDP